MDFPLNQTLDFKWTSKAADSHVPVSIVGGDAVVYRDNVATPISAGITFTSDFNSVTGLNNVRIEATVANGYIAGSSYQVVISAGTVNSNPCVGTVIAEFSIGRTGGSVGAAMEVTRTSDVVTTGTETGTSGNTLLEDGNEWVITSVSAGINAELVFNVGTQGNENPSAFRIWGRFDSGSSRVLQLQAYNFTEDKWENRGETLRKANTNFEIIRTLGTAYVKRGAGGPGVAGDVRIRFLYDTNVSNKVNAGDTLHLDKVSVFYTLEGITTGELFGALVSANPQRNYPDSAIVIDTENGQPGQIFGVNGYPGNPVSNLTDALALAQEAGFTRFIIRANSQIVLNQAYPDWEFILSPRAEIDLNGQDVDNSAFVGGVLKGVGLAASSGISVVGARLNAVTANGIFRGCTLPVADSLSANGTILFLLGCRSVRPGAANPSIKGGSVAGLSLSVVDYGGGIDIDGLANDANVTVSGRGSVALTDAATTATVILSGNMRKVGATPTGANVIETARVDQPQITAAAWADGTAPNGAAMSRAVDGIGVGTVDTGGTATTFSTSSLDPPVVDADQFKGRIVTFDKNTATTGLRGQSTVIESVTSGGLFTVTALSQAPAAGDTFTIQ